MPRRMTDNSKRTGAAIEALPAERSPAITRSCNPSRKLRTQIGLLNETLLAPVDRKEIPLRFDPQILALHVAEAHHPPEQSVTVWAVIREQTIDARFDEHGLRQLFLN